MIDDMYSQRYDNFEDGFIDDYLDEYMDFNPICECPICKKTIYDIDNIDFDKNNNLVHSKCLRGEN